MKQKNIFLLMLIVSISFFSCIITIDGNIEDVKTISEKDINTKDREDNELDAMEDFNKKVPLLEAEPQENNEEQIEELEVNNELAEKEREEFDDRENDNQVENGVEEERVEPLEEIASRGIENEQEIAEEHENESIEENQLEAEIEEEAEERGDEEDIPEEVEEVAEENIADEEAVISCDRPHVTFEIQNLYAHPANADWMFDTDRTPFRQDANSSVYAYRSFAWDYSGDAVCRNEGELDLHASSLATVEETTILDGVNNVTLVTNPGTISSFRHMNVVNPARSFQSLGEAGDLREYSDGDAAITVNGDVKLRTTDVTFNLLVAYPSPVGPGGNQGYAVGVGTAEIDAAASDPSWVLEFDPNNTGLVEISFDSMSPTLQGCYGRYNVTVTIRPIANDGCRDPRNNDDDGDDIVDAIDIY